MKTSRQVNCTHINHYIWHLTKITADTFQRIDLYLWMLLLLEWFPGVHTQTLQSKDLPLRWDWNEHLVRFGCQHLSSFSPLKCVHCSQTVKSTFCQYAYIINFTHQIQLTVVVTGNTSLHGKTCTLLWLWINWPIMTSHQVIYNWCWILQVW